MTETETPTSLTHYIYTSARTSARGEGGFPRREKKQVSGAGNLKKIPPAVLKIAGESCFFL